MSPVVIHAYTADRATANDASLESRAAGLSERDGRSNPSIRLPCFAHVAATIQGRCFAPVGTYITGVIALALVHAAGGEVAAFRKMLIHVLQLGTVVHSFTNHVRAVGWSSYRDSVLGLLLPDSIQGKARLQNFRRFLTGDITSDPIEMFFEGGCDLRTWAEQVAANLLPGVLPLHARHRWVASYDIVGQCALLDLVHGLLRRAGVPWLQQQTTAKVKAVRPMLADGWGVSDSDDDAGEGEAQEPVPVAAIMDGLRESDGEGDVDALIEYGAGTGADVPIADAAANPSTVFVEFNQKNNVRKAWLCYGSLDRPVEDMCC